MQVFQGKAVSPGIVMGPVVVWQKENNVVQRRQVEDAEEELARLEAAFEVSKEQLCQLSENDIFRAHQILLEDEGFIDRVRRQITAERLNAEYAVWQVCGDLEEMFANLADPFMRERVADIRDVSVRLIQNLEGGLRAVPVLKEPAIIVAEEISPSETMQLDREKVLALVTLKGSCYSHAAILARSLSIPALVGVNVKEIASLFSEGRSECADSTVFAVVDTETERLLLQPDSETVQEYTSKKKEQQERSVELQEYRDRESVTLDGKKIHICANVGSEAEIREALENGADGIGLFRSEFLFLGREIFPTEEEQFEAYRQAVMTLQGKRVIIRTLDIGADKQAECLGLVPEVNPALGCRGIRLCLKRPEMFKVQLRALLRASVYGNLAIMYPMIASVEEVIQVRELLAQVAEELERQGVEYRIPPQGVMIETPAAVMISDELAEMVDFFSIGTNDLTQYALGMDRQNEGLEEFYNPHHKAVLRMISMTVKNAHQAGKWVGICGELATDIMLTEEFIRMGVDELSVVPGEVLPLRKVVRSLKADK